MINFFTGNQVLEWCEACINDTNIALGNQCPSYIGGAVDAHETYVGWGDMGMRFCLPLSIKISQLVRVVTKYLQESPEVLHIAAGAVVGNALYSAFPCR